MRRLYDDSPFLVAGTRLGGFHGYDDGRRHRADGRGGHRVRQVLQARAPGGAGQGGRPARRAGRPRSRSQTCSSTRRCATPAASRSATSTACAGASGSSSGRSRRRTRRSDGALALGPDSVVLVTGAAGSIVSAITADLAKASGGDLPPARPHARARPRRPRPASATSRTGTASRPTSPRRMKDRGERPTPVAIEKELARLRAAGRRAGRHRRRRGRRRHRRTTTRVDLTDADAVARVLDRVREIQRPHRPAAARRRAWRSAGRCPDKEPREFDLVLGVKADGWFNVLHGRRRPADRRDGRLLLGGRPVRQRRADRLQRGQRPALQDHQQPAPDPARAPARSRSTGPPGAGSAWRPAAPSPRSWRWRASRCCRPRPASPGSGASSPAHGFRGEVVVAGALGPDGRRLPPDRRARAGRRSTSCGQRWSARWSRRTSCDGLVVQTTLDPTAQPFLDDHRIDGTAVLPGVMGMEAFAEVAAAAGAGAGTSSRSRTSTSWRR